LDLTEERPVAPFEPVNERRALHDGDDIGGTHGGDREAHQGESPKELHENIE
jgi:hypothetical protein